MINKFHQIQMLYWKHSNEYLLCLQQGINSTTVIASKKRYKHNKIISPPTKRAEWMHFICIKNVYVLISQIYPMKQYDAKWNNKLDSK
jgi:hypothetical protein